MSQVPLPPDGPLLAEPMVLFDGSFIIEFLQPPPSLDSTVLMRATYKHDHPLTQKGKKHPQAPPLHIHFTQAESLHVLQGKIGLTLSYGMEDRIFTPSDGTYRIDAWVPHRFWPVPESSSSSSAAAEDCVLLIWAHPSSVRRPMDWVFFANLLGYVSDVSAGEVGLDLLQVMYMQHVTDSALVVFPSASFLGPLRWWVPWVMQAGLAAVAKMLGYLPLIEKYTPPAEWKKLKQGLKMD